MDRDWTDKRMDDFADRVDRFEANVDKRFDRVDAHFDKIDARFDKIEARFDKVDAKERSASVDAAIAALGVKLDRTHRWLTGGLGTIVAAVILKAFVG